MTTLYIDHKNVELDVSGKTLLIRENGERSGSIPLGLLERVVVMTNTRLETRVINTLAENDTGLVILQRRSRENVAILMGKPHNDCRRRQQQALISMDEPRAATIVQTLIRLKLQQQMKLLIHLHNSRSEKRKPLTDGIRTLEKILKEVRNLDHTSPGSIGQLRGYEGAGAAHYFPAYASVFPPALDFTERNRRPPRDPVNACLSLGYTLLHAEAVMSIYRAGLDPYMGFLHDPQHGRESLACDLVEPLRPMLDRHIGSLFRERILRPEHFTDDQGACRMGKEARKRYYQEYEQRLARKLRRILSISVYRLIRFFDHHETQ